jgi:hypothetical protein
MQKYSPNDLLMLTGRGLAALAALRAAPQVRPFRVVAFYLRQGAPAQGPGDLEVKYSEVVDAHAERSEAEKQAAFLSERAKAAASRGAAPITYRVVELDPAVALAASQARP